MKRRELKAPKIIKLSKHKNPMAIAKELGISCQYVSKILKDNNIKPLSVYQDIKGCFGENMESIMERLKNGETMKEISLSFGFNECTLSVYMGRKGIKHPNPPKPKPKIPPKPKPVKIKPPVKQPNCWQKSEKAKLPPIKVRVKKLRVYPLPETGQCKFYSDNMELCSNSIDKGSYCQEHNNLCYVGSKK